MSDQFNRISGKPLDQVQQKSLSQEKLYIAPPGVLDSSSVSFPGDSVRNHPIMEKWQKMDKNGLNKESEEVERILQDSDLSEKKRRRLACYNTAIADCRKTWEELGQLRLLEKEQQSVRFEAEKKCASNLARLVDCSLASKQYEMMYNLVIEQKIEYSKPYRDEKLCSLVDGLIASLEERTKSNLDQEQRRSLNKYMDIMDQWVKAREELTKPLSDEERRYPLKALLGAIEGWMEEIDEKQEAQKDFDLSGFLKMSERAEAAAKWIDAFSKLFHLYGKYICSTAEQRTLCCNRLDCSGKLYKEFGRSSSSPIVDQLKLLQNELETEEKLAKLRSDGEVPWDTCTALLEESQSRSTELRGIINVLMYESRHSDESPQETSNLIEISTTQNQAMAFTAAQTVFTGDAIKPPTIRAIGSGVALQYALNSELFGENFTENAKKFLKPFLDGNDEEVLKIPAIASLGKNIYQGAKYAFFTDFLKDDYQAFSHLKTFLEKSFPEIKEYIPKQDAYNSLRHGCLWQFANNGSLNQEAIQEFSDQDVVQKVTKLLALETSPEERQDIAHNIKLLGIHRYSENITSAMWKQQFKEREAMNQIIPGLYSLQKDTADSGMTFFRQVTDQLQQFFRKREKIRVNPKINLITEEHLKFLKNRLTKLKEEQEQFKKKIENLEQ